MEMDTQDRFGRCHRAVQTGRLRTGIGRIYRQSLNLLWGFAALTLAAGPSLGGGLGCEKPTAVDTFLSLDAVAHLDVVAVYGTVAFDETLLPDPFAPGFEQPIGTSAPIATTLWGKTLTTGGFTLDFERQVTFEISCANYACGYVGSEKPLVFFLPAQPTGAPILLHQCDNIVFNAPSAETLEMLVSCAQGDTCTSVQ